MRARLVGWVAAGALVLLVVVGTLRGQDTSRFAATTYGVGPFGYRALYESLSRLGFPVRRGASVDVPPPGAVWWVGADVCRADDDPHPWAGIDFARRGGIAVGILTTGVPRTCHLGDGIRVVTRTRNSFPADTVDGPLAPRGRRLDPQRAAGGLRITKATALWRQALGAGEAAIVVERLVGRGRVVIMTNGQLLANGDLERGDHAAIAVDLVRGYGPPVFDDVAAFRHTRGLLAYLAGSAAAPVFLGLAGVGLLVVWYGSLLPARRLPPLADPTPRLEAFVESIATLYARTRDHGRVLARYRTFAIGVLRRHFSLDPHVSPGVVVARARRRRPDLAAEFTLLEAGTPVPDAKALRAATATLDRLLGEVCR